jgi:hypothetical protein
MVGMVFGTVGFF